MLDAAGCASSPYLQAQEAWTRSVDGYRGMEAQAFVRATLKTEPFRRAYAAEYGRLFALNSEQRTALLEGEFEELADAWVVVVALYTAASAANDLDPASGIWEVRLEGARGAWNPPTKVRRLPRKNPTWRAFYPYYEAHYSLYELRFDRRTPEGAALAVTGETLRLVLAGAPAQLALSWPLP